MPNPPYPVQRDIDIRMPYFARESQLGGLEIRGA